MKKQFLMRRALCLAAAGLTAGGLCSACDSIYGDTALIDIYGNEDGSLNWVGEIVEEGGSKHGSGNVVRIIEIDGSKRTTFTCAVSPNVPLPGDNPRCPQTKKEICDFGDAAATVTGDCPGEVIEDTDLSKRESLYKASFTNRACPVGYEIRKAKDTDDGGYYECISVKCGSVATSVLSNDSNCGGCGVECKEDNAKCIEGICQKTSLCSEDQTLCNGTCIVIKKNNVEACNNGNNSNPFECAQGYAHLDSILTNGCETKLSDVHIAQTERDKTGAIVSITCENGYADLDDKLTNGCETKLSDIHVTQTELNEKGTVVSITCENGYGNLDEKLTNGCETKLSDVHVEKVTKTETGEVSIECAKGYKNCDNLIVTGCETNITNNDDHCGECNQPCPSGSIDNMITAECKNSICNVYCASNYKSNSSGECEFDPSYTCCGYEFDNTCKNCTIHIPGSIKGTCTYDKEKGLQECSVSKGDCNVGYGYSEEEAKCVPSECLSDEECKEESGKSGANLCDKYTGKCRCGDLATPCSGKKQFCKETDKDTVCIECIDNDDCPVSDGVKTVICDNNACSIKECQLGYHFSDNQCVVDDESNCYGKGKCPEEFPFCSREKQGCVGCVKNADCESLQDKNNAKNMVCNTETNTCKVPENGCKDGYGYYEGICYKLKKSNKDHVGTVINIGNKEIVYSCTDGYLPNDDKTKCNVTCSVNENCASTTDGYHKCKQIKIKNSYKYLCACGDTSTVCSPNQTCNPTDKRDSDKFEQWTYECLNPAIN